MKREYELIEHTADVGVRVRAPSPGELFANAAYAMFDLIGNIESARPQTGCSVAVEAADYEELLVNWLTELLFLFETERLLLCEFDVEEIDARHLRAKVRGEKYDPDRHELETDIKAVTYFGLHVAQHQEGWSAAVVFDI